MAKLLAMMSGISGSAAGAAPEAQRADPAVQLPAERHAVKDYFPCNPAIPLEPGRGFAVETTGTDAIQAQTGRSMLAQMNERLRRTRTFEDAIQTILDDAIALQGAEYGNVQLPIGDELAIVAQRGLSADFLYTFRRVKKDDGCACGRALRSGSSIIIGDVEKDPEFAAFRNDAKVAGFRGVQSTPFLTTDGRLLGMVSTHFAEVHEPTPIEMETLKAYGVVAADYAFGLLGNDSLAAKAEQMSEKLYSDILDRLEAG